MGVQSSLSGRSCFSLRIYPVSEGWQWLGGRWSRLLKPCQPPCKKGIPRVAEGKVECTETDKASLSCTLTCRSGYTASLYEVPMSQPTQAYTFTCYRGDWNGIPRCLKLS